MKLIVAIIRPERLEAVQKALNEHDVYLMTVTDVRGCGRQRGYTEVYRGTEFIALPCIGGVAIIERPIVGLSRA